MVQLFVKYVVYAAKLAIDAVILLRSREYVSFFENYTCIFSTMQFHFIEKFQNILYFVFHRISYKPKLK